MGVGMNDSEIWELRHGDILIGTLYVTEQDLPWYNARFEPASAYAEYRPVFEEGTSVRSGDDPEVWSTWRKKVQDLGLRLIRLHDQAVASDYILYIEGSAADFRPYIDT
jgi:hypothetical protein